MTACTSLAHLTLPPEPASIAEARRFIREHGCPQQAADQVETAVLLVSELVTNAVRHGSPPILLQLECATERHVLHVRVSDASPRLPTPTQASIDDEGGRGLAITAVLSDAWGVDPRSDGKTVWFRLRSPDE